MSIEIKTEKSGDIDLISYSGAIDENASAALAPLLRSAGARCVINFSRLSSINSVGVRAWLIFWRNFKVDRKVTFVECPPDFVNQLAVMPAMSAGAEIRSIFGSYVCENCGHEKRVLFEVGRNMPAPGMGVPSLACDQCKSPMNFDDDPDAFFSFLQRG